jgi:hypothetical protein
MPQLTNANAIADALVEGARHLHLLGLDRAAVGERKLHQEQDEEAPHPLRLGAQQEDSQRRSGNECEPDRGGVGEKPSPMMA